MKKKMIYLDNAATSYPKPQCVIKEFLDTLKNAGGNPARSSHTLSLKATEKIYSARESIAGMFGTYKEENVVFTYNATTAINMALKSYLKPGDHVITSDIEHNAVIRPLEALRRSKGISCSCFDSSEDAEQEIARLLTPQTTCIVSTLASNVTGKTVDLSSLSKAAKKHGLYLILDAAQSAGHHLIDLSVTDFDVLCAPAHKGLFGIQGCGFAIFKENERKESFIEGGSGYESASKEMPLTLPEGYEAGTPATGAIAALGAGVRLVNSIGIERIQKKLETLNERAIEIIKSVKGSIVYPSDSGIVSFNISGIPSNGVAYLLNKRGICVRDGLHCAPSAHKKLGTISSGTVRVSFSYFNKMKDIDLLYKALKEISDNR